MGLHRSASLSLGFTAPLAWPLTHLPAWASGRTGLDACPFNQHLQALPQIVRAASSLSRITNIRNFRGLFRWCEATLREIEFMLSPSTAFRINLVEVQNPVLRFSKNPVLNLLKDSLLQLILSYVEGLIWAAGNKPNKENLNSRKFYPYPPAHPSCQDLSVKVLAK